MANTALCIRCGTFKKNYAAVCSGCGFLPMADADVAKSRILDFPYIFSIGPNGAFVETGRTVAELQVIVQQIKGGNIYTFHDQEVADVLEVVRQFKQTTPKQVWLDVARWLAPTFLLAVAAAYLLYISPT